MRKRLGKELKSRMEYKKYREGPWEWTRMPLRNTTLIYALYNRLGRELQISRPHTPLENFLHQFPLEGTNHE